MQFYFNFFKILFAVLFVQVPIVLLAAPLGRIPLVDRGNPRIVLDSQTDLWVSPYKNKETPQRTYQTQLKIPFIKNESLTASLNIENEGRSLGRPDLLVGKKQVYIGTDPRAQSLGLAIEKRNDDQSVFSFFISHESFSDEPFQHRRDISQSFTLVYALPADSDKISYWVFGLNKSANRGVWNNQYMPFVGYSLDVNTHTRIIIGLLFFRLDWADAHASQGYVVLTPVGLDMEFSRRFSSNVYGFTRSGVSNRSYTHINRLEDDMRLILEEKFVDIGMRTPLSDNANVSLYVGYGFDRKAYEAKTVFFPSGPVNRIGSDLYGGVQLEYSFK